MVHVKLTLGHQVNQSHLHKVVQAHALQCPADVTQLPHKCVLLRPPVGYLALQPHAFVSYLLAHTTLDAMSLREWVETGHHDLILSRWSHICLVIGISTMSTAACLIQTCNLCEKGQIGLLHPFAGCPLCKLCDRDCDWGFAFSQRKAVTVGL